MYQSTFLRNNSDRRIKNQIPHPSKNNSSELIGVLQLRQLHFRTSIIHSHTHIIIPPATSSGVCSSIVCVFIPISPHQNHNATFTRIISSEQKGSSLLLTPTKGCGVFGTHMYVYVSIQTIVGNRSDGTGQWLSASHTASTQSSVALGCSR